MMNPKCQAAGEREDKVILSFESFEEVIGYHFSDRSLLECALTHRSYINETGGNRADSNERLEFLGDAVLELISSDRLYHEYPQDPEGELSRIRASLVCEKALSMRAEAIGLGRMLFLGKGEEKSGGRTRPSITSDALEALIGAIYLDGGYGQAERFVNRHVLKDLAPTDAVDDKTRLQEMIQAKGDATIRYRLVGESGPDHDKRFTMQVMIDGTPGETGTGRNKKEAEQMAAHRALERLAGSQET